MQQQEHSQQAVPPPPSYKARGGSSAKAAQVIDATFLSLFASPKQLFRTRSSRGVPSGRFRRSPWRQPTALWRPSPRLSGPFQREFHNRPCNSNISSRPRRSSRHSRSRDRRSSHSPSTSPSKRGLTALGGARHPRTARSSRRLNSLLRKPRRSLRSMPRECSMPPSRHQRRRSSSSRCPTVLPGPRLRRKRKSAPTPLHPTDWQRTRSRSMPDQRGWLPTGLWEEPGGSLCRIRRRRRPMAPRRAGPGARAEPALRRRPPSPRQARRRRRTPSRTTRDPRGWSPTGLREPGSARRLRCRTTRRYPSGQGSWSATGMCKGRRRLLLRRWLRRAGRKRADAELRWAGRRTRRMRQLKARRGRRRCGPSWLRRGTERRRQRVGVGR